MESIISVSQFDRDYIEKLFSLTDTLKKSIKSDRLNLLSGTTVTCLFYQPSTRTYASFLAATQKLGGSIIPIQGVEYSSVSKGESFEDTIKTLSLYSDCIVLRHPEVGSAQKAVNISSKPIINAGDGVGEHPTQALLDLYTIVSSRGYNISGMHIAFVGDILHSRTIHSLCKLLSLYDVKVSFIGPEELLDNKIIPPHCKQYNSLTKDIIKDVDVLYMTRIQKEYFDAKLLGKDFSYSISEDLLSAAPKNMLLMHPFPRVSEIPSSIDSDPRAAYFKQIENGLYVRAALLAKTLKGF